jgi:hypothetical protein
MLKTIKLMMDEENTNYRKLQKKHYEREQYLMKQATCIHDCIYIPDEPADSFCFAPEMPQRIKGAHLNIELWNVTTTPVMDLVVMKHILIDMDIDIKKPLER